MTLGFHCLEVIGGGMQLKFRAIVVDDMDFCRDLLADFLNERGYEVFSFPDVTACPLFPARNSSCPQQNACADFLLTDNRMPHMQGLDFLELQRQGKCPITTARKAIFSAHWTAEELSRAEQLECQIFHKPYDLLTLSSWLDQQEKLILPERTLTPCCQIMSRPEDSDKT
jgi:CheY-like chemotaxis protein